MPLNLHQTRYFILTGIILLAGCTSARDPIHIAINTDYRIQIQRTFEDLPNGSYIDLQQGLRIQSGNLDRWSTYCRLYVYNPDHGADYRTAIVPGTVHISAVKAAYQSSDYPTQPRFAEFSWGVRDHPAYYLYHVGMRLISDEQPDVRSLVCYKKWATPRANQFPTLAEIRTALGDQIKLDLHN